MIVKYVGGRVYIERTLHEPFDQIIWVEAMASVKGGRQRSAMWAECSGRTTQPGSTLDLQGTGKDIYRVQYK